MWIVGPVTMVSVLASGLASDVVEPSPPADGWDGPVSYVHAQEVREPRIWLDRGVDPVLQAGDRVRVYYRTDIDAYVAILQIDTDGTTRMLYPRSPSENHYAREGRDYRLLFPRSAYWNVGDRPGVGYFFIVTSPAPFDFSDFGYSYYDAGWDLSAVGSTVYSDPYVAIDEYVARLVPDWEFVDYGLDVISYSVGSAHEYPRFLCYQCHGFRPYSTWNPYRYACLDFRVVVYDDPYFYPSYRYGPERVVVVGPRNPARPRFEFKERARGEPGTPVTVVRQGRVRGDAPPPLADPPAADPERGRARVAAPPVVAPDAPADRRASPDQNRTPPATTRPPAPSGQAPTPPPATTRRPAPSDPDGIAPVGPGSGRVVPPRADDREPPRPILQRRSDPQSPSPGSGVARPRPAPQRPSRQSDPAPSRQPASPRAQPSTRPSPRRPAPPSPAARRPPRSSSGSPSARPAPRQRSPAPSTRPGAAPAPRGRPAPARRR